MCSGSAFSSLFVPEGEAKTKTTAVHWLTKSLNGEHQIKTRKLHDSFEENETVMKNNDEIDVKYETNRFNMGMTRKCKKKNSI